MSKYYQENEIFLENLKIVSENVIKISKIIKRYLSNCQKWSNMSRNSKISKQKNVKRTQNT